MKKLILFMMLLTLSVGLATGQTPWSITHSRNDEPVRAVKTQEGVTVQQAGVSLKNLWIGSSVLWNLDEEASIEAPGVNGTLMYTAYSNERFGLPIYGNIALGQDGPIWNPDEGVTLGLYPWYELGQSNGFTLIAHGGVGYRRYTDKDGLEDVDVTEIKIFGGLEVALSPGGGLPLTVSVAPVYRMNQGMRPDGTTLEVTGILPMGNGLGLMAEGDFPFDGDTGSLFRMGILVNGRL